MERAARAAGQRLKLDRDRVELALEQADGAAREELVRLIQGGGTGALEASRLVVGAGLDLARTPQRAATAAVWNEVKSSPGE